MDGMPQFGLVMLPSTQRPHALRVLYWRHGSRMPWKQNSGSSRSRAPHKGMHWALNPEWGWNNGPGKRAVSPNMHPSDHCSTVYSSQDVGQPRRPPAEEWAKKTRPICTVEHHSATAVSEAVPFAETRINPETLIQREVGKKNKYCVLTRICGIQKNGTDEPICKAEIETEI